MDAEAERRYWLAVIKAKQKLRGLYCGDENKLNLRAALPQMVREGKIK